MTTPHRAKAQLSPIVRPVAALAGWYQNAANAVTGGHTVQGALASLVAAQNAANASWGTRQGALASLCGALRAP